MKKTIDQMTCILQENNLGGQVLEKARKKEVGNPLGNKEKG